MTDYCLHKKPCADTKFSQKSETMPEHHSNFRPNLQIIPAGAGVKPPLFGAGDKDDDDGGGFEPGVATKVRPKTKRPSLYRVLLLNDDYTPMEFVIAVLQEVFSKTQEDAFQIMMHVHKSGVGECGVFPYEVAETKVMRVMDSAQKNQHPLQCVMEKQ